MIPDEVPDLFRALECRYGIAIDCADWRSQEMPGGIAMVQSSIAALASAASKYGDARATAYEMESTNREFDPVEVELSEEGFRQLRSLIVSHFDLLLVPESRRWALFLSNEMEGFVIGSEMFLDDLKRNEGRSGRSLG